MCAWCILPNWIWCIGSTRQSSSTPSTPSTPAAIDRSAVKSTDHSCASESKWYVRCGRGIKAMPSKCGDVCRKTLAKGCKKEVVVVVEEDKEEKVTESTTQASLDPFLSSADQVEPVSNENQKDGEEGSNDLTRIKTRTPDLLPISSTEVPSKSLGGTFVERCKGLVGGGGGGKKEEK
ncbi:hypothetical protein JCM5353_007756 [Sporobolomyces roseus]